MAWDVTVVNTLAESYVNISASPYGVATPPFRKKFKGSCPHCPWKHSCKI